MTAEPVPTSVPSISKSPSDKRLSEQDHSHGRVSKLAKTATIALNHQCTQVICDTKHESNFVQSQTSRETVSVDVIRDGESPVTSSDNLPTGAPVVLADVPTIPVGASKIPAKTNKQSFSSVSNRQSDDAQEKWGHLKHRFNFVSAYKHSYIQRLHPDIIPEVTSQHSLGQGTNVDYIFFTG